jgi:pimeloyl-ACP methyl ester carboxylesterase
VRRLDPGSALPPRSLRSYGSPTDPGVLCLAGFGDDSTMFEPLVGTPLSSTYRLVLVDLPGFGSEPPFVGTFATISRLSHFVNRVAESEGTEIVIAHSIASVIASAAAGSANSIITTIVSMEGNLTAPDAYYSGLAADYEHPESFREALLCRLDDAASTDPIIARYRSRIARADPHALWILGNEAVAFGDRVVPGEALRDAARAHYLYNPTNCSESSIAWLEDSGISAVKLPGTSHWATIDAPGLVAAAVRRVLTA